jgi:hypothetical protein
MKTHLVVPVTLMLASLGTPLAHAQSISGRLIDATSGGPIDRAFVVLIAASGTDLERILTDAQGEFTLRAPGAGTYQLRSERIGVKATTFEEIRVPATGTRDLELEVEPIVIRLDAIVIKGDAKKCRIYGEQGLETATVWEEARKALAGVAWSESAEMLTFEIRSYKQFIEANGRPSHTRESVIRRTSVMPFRNPDAQTLHDRGYVIEDSSVYYAPDAEVFFSDVFLSQHCFKLKRDNDYQGMVGLEFEPTKGRDVPDVKGVLWLDEQTASLRWLELGYTSLRSHIRRRHAEARIDFEQLPNGMWFVSSWAIRMPQVEIERPRVAGPTRRQEVLWGFEEDGREVLKVTTTAGQILYEAPEDEKGS